MWRSRQGLPRLVHTLLEGGGRPADIARMAARVGDASADRLIELAVADLGPPPAEFAFLTLGSQGAANRRWSATRTTRSSTPTRRPNRRPRPSGIPGAGQLVTAGLERAGYALCRGQTMARNPRWCRPASAWRGYFADWIGGATPQDLLEFDTFFDFRSVAGQGELADVFFARVDRADAARPAAVLHPPGPKLAALQAAAWLLRPDPDRIGRHGGQAINLKDAMMPICEFRPTLCAEARAWPRRTRWTGWRGSSGWAC